MQLRRTVWTTITLWDSESGHLTSCLCLALSSCYCILIFSRAFLAFLTHRHICICLAETTFPTWEVWCFNFTCEKLLELIHSIIFLLGQTFNLRISAGTGISVATTQEANIRCWPQYTEKHLTLSVLVPLSVPVSTFGVKPITFIHKEWCSGRTITRLIWVWYHLVPQTTGWVTSGRTSDVKTLCLTCSLVNSLHFWTQLVP